jgi:hypothetical protein
MQADLNKVIGAIREFYARETFLFDKDLGERTVTHRMAVHVENHFPSWNIDCDYNRLGERIWRLPRASIVSTDDDLGKSIYPDIVVHKREVPTNLLAIEVRRDGNHQPLEHDQRKLSGLTDPKGWFAYDIGAMLILGKRGVTLSEIYVGGAVHAGLSDWFAARLEQEGLGAKPHPASSPR